MFLEAFQIEAGVTSAGKWTDYLGIPCCCVLSAFGSPFQKPGSDWMKVIAASVGQEAVSVPVRQDNDFYNTALFYKLTIIIDQL